MQARRIVNLSASAQPLAKERRVLTILSLMKREVDKYLPSLLPSSSNLEEDLATPIRRHALSAEFTPVESMVLQIDNQNKDDQPSLFTVEAKGEKDQGVENQEDIIYLKLLTRPFGGRFTEATLMVEFVDPGSVHLEYFFYDQYRLMYIQIQMNLFPSYRSFLTTKNLIHCLSIMSRRRYMREQ